MKKSNLRFMKLPLFKTETLTGLMNKTVTRTYETTGVPGRNTGLNLGADYSVTYGYEPATGRFNSVSWTASGQTGSAAYSYLPNSDLLSQLMTGDGQLVTYSYEPNRNLKIQVKNQFGTTVISQYDYQLDALGRRTNMTTSGSAPWGILNLQSSILNYSVNNLNQYTQVDSSILNLESEILNLNYDADGNLISSQKEPDGTLYAYDAENRLIAVEPLNPTSGTTKVEFAYDYMGRRVEKKVYSYNAGSWLLASDSFFLYDGWNLIFESTVIGQQPPVVKNYIWGLDLSQSLQGAGGVGGLLAVVDNGETYHYFYDGNGNVAQLVKVSDGSIAAHYEYDPYGNIVVESGSLAKENPFCYSTKYKDSETNLFYFGYRYYSPELGRWMSRDPSEEENGISLYVFVDNDPINYIDDIGLRAISLPIPETPPPVPTPETPIPGPKPTIWPKIPPAIKPSPSWIKWGAFWPALITTLLDAGPFGNGEPGPADYPWFSPDSDDNDDKKCHRGRIQAQGGGTEKSVKWAQNTPLTYTQGSILLQTLTSMLTSFEMQQRTSALISASAWIKRTAASGGTDPTAVSFIEFKYTKKKNLIKDPDHTRIDIEVKAGRAFVPY